MQISHWFFVFMYIYIQELDAMLPPTGYEIVPPPTGYEAIRTPARKLTETPTPMAGGADMSGLVRIH